MIVDSREKVFNHITSFWEEKGIEYHIFKKEDSMKIGDYSMAVKTDTGEVIDFRNKIVVERKADLVELVGNFTSAKDSEGNTRIVREFIRAKENNIKVLLLVEDLKGYNNAIRGYLRKDKPSKMNSKAFLAMLFTYQARYGFDLVFIDKKDSASYIYNYLYYQAREYLRSIEV
jgi:hypothetical protein